MPRKMKYKKGDIIEIKEELSCLRFTIPKGENVIITYVDYLLKTYDIKWNGQEMFDVNFQDLE